MMPFSVERDDWGDECVWYYRTPTDDYPVLLLNSNSLIQQTSNGGQQLWDNIANMIHEQNQETAHGSR